MTDGSTNKILPWCRNSPMDCFLLQSVYLMVKIVGLTGLLEKEQWFSDYFVLSLQTHSHQTESPDWLLKLVSHRHQFKHQTSPFNSRLFLQRIPWVFTNRDFHLGTGIMYFLFLSVSYSNAERDFPVPCFHLRNHLYN